MADSTKLRTSLALFMQDLLSETVRDSGTEEMPTLRVLMGFLAQREGDTTDGIGVPGASNLSGGQLLSGGKIPQARRKDVLTGQTYMPLLLKNTLADDGKNMSQRDTMPTVTTWTATHALTQFARPEFKYVRRISPFKVSNEDLDAIDSKMGSGTNAARIARFDLWGSTVKNTIKVQMRYWNTALFGAYTAGPSNVDAEGVWDAPYSLAALIHSSNICAGVDRSLSANAYFRGNYVTSAMSKSLVSLLDDANYGTPACAKFSTPIRLVVTGNALFQTFLAEARSIGAQIVSPGSIPEFAQIGFKRNVIEYAGAYCMCDFACPANYVYCLNPDSFTIAMGAGHNFNVTEPYDESKPEGGDDASSAKIKTRLMIAQEAPSTNVLYTNVTA